MEGRWRHMVTAALMLVFGLGAWGQEAAVLHGRVTSGGRGVPYATLQLQGTAIGVSCNDEGRYEMKLPAGHEADTVVVRSVGYEQARLTVAQLVRHGDVRLKQHEVALGEVEVRGYRSGRYLLQEAVDRIADNYCDRQAWSTFFYRDWRAVDGQLYLFDEAVMAVERAPYNAFIDKKTYRFDSERREMESNYKSLLRHRLLVYDRPLLAHTLENPDGVDEMLTFDDNQDFFDPVYTPQASYSLARRVLGMHMFEPVQEFVSDGVGYYRVVSVGPCRTPGAKVRYEYTVRKSDLAIVGVTSTERRARNLTTLEAWINFRYNRLVVEADSSAWVYDVRDGRYTLTRYYNYKQVRLEATRGRHKGDNQLWQQSIEWTLTDFSAVPPVEAGDTIGASLQTLAGAFGTSDYSTDYWGHYNSILLDSLPARLLEEKLKSKKP